MDEFVWICMSQKILVNKFQWIEETSQFNEFFIKIYNQEIDEGNFLEIDVQWPKKLHELHNDLPFFSERMKLEKFEKLVTNLYDKTEHSIHIGNLKQALNHWLILKEVHRVIKFNQHAWLTPYIDMNTELREKPKNIFEKDFFKLMNNAVFRKFVENVRKHTNIKLVTTEGRRNCLISEPKNYPTKVFTEDLLAIEMKKTKILMNKPVYLGLSILDLSKTVTYEFWYDYVKP